MELMASTEDYGKHYSGGKAARQEIMVSRSLGSTRDRITPWMGTRGVWFIGDYDGDIGTYAFCLTFGESYRLLDRSENTRMALLSVQVTVFCTQITTRRDDRGRS